MELRIRKTRVPVGLSLRKTQPPARNQRSYYYYHAGHPSTAVHKTVGDKLYAEIQTSH